MEAYTCFDVESLERLHTKQLIVLLRSAWRDRREYREEVPYDVWMAQIANIRAVLSKRPHIPSKHESRELRKARKRSGTKRPTLITRPLGDS